MRPIAARSVYEPICVKTPVAGNPIASHVNRFPFTLDRLPFTRAMTIRHNADDNNTKEGYGDSQPRKVGFHRGLPFDTFCPFGIISMPKRSSKQKDTQQLARSVLDAIVPDAEPAKAQPAKNPAA